MTFRLAITDRSARTRLEWPDGRRQSVFVGSNEIRLRRVLALPPGTSRIRFETEARSAIATPGDRRKGLYLRFLDFELVPTVLERAARRAERS